MSRVTPETVQRVATLARLQLTDQEVDRLVHELAAILDYIDQLNSVDTSQVTPMSHALSLKNVMRDDAVRASLPPEAVTKIAPASTGSFIRVPKVIDA